MSSQESSFEVRPLQAEDREQWLRLWRGYLQFYDKTIPPELIDFTWTRLTETGEISGLIAVDPHGTGLGLVQFFYHPSTSTFGGNCYIQDLFVDPVGRRRGVGRTLIRRVVELAKGKAVDVVYWQTEEFNGTARRLYERVAKRSPFIRYQIDLR